MNWQKKLLQQGEVDELQQRLDNLKYGVPKDDYDNNIRRSGGEGGSGGTPGSPRPSKTPQWEIDTSRLDRLRGNTV